MFLSCFLYLFLLLFDVLDEVGLLCQFLFLWLMNQLFICLNCNPVSCTSLALSSSYEHNPYSSQDSNTSQAIYELTVGYGHLEWVCHQVFNVDVVSPGSFPALLFRRISSLISTIFSLYPFRSICYGYDRYN